MKNHYSSTVSTVLGFFFLFFAGTALAGGELPSTYQDDVYHCEDPKSNTNLIRCDPTTYLWDIGDLNPKKEPDDSLLCEEIVKILVKAVAEAKVDPGAQQASETQREVELWESIMQTSVVDQMEPCVLWAMSFGALTPYAEMMGLYEQLTDDAVSELVMPNGQLPNFDGNDDPLSSILETEFDPFMIALAWSSPLSEPFSLNQKELDDITSRHVKGALSAELGADKITQFDLTVEPGLPDYKAQILPLTLSGKVSFNDQLDDLDSASLQKTILDSAFINSNALDLYLFRLEISKEPTLQTVSKVVAGKETVDLYIESSNPSNGGADFVSKLLIAILLAVGAAIVAILCFAYFLIFRPRSSGKVIETLEETSNNSGNGSGQTSRMSNNKGMFKREFNDGVPGVRTAPTEEAYEEEESQYDIEYAAASNDGVSEYDMDTLPSHPAYPEESDDDQSHEMSVIEGFDDEDLQEETIAGNSQTSDDNVSLYSYIPTDTSLVAEQTALEKVEKKGVLWSVEQQQKAPVDSDAESYAFSTVQSFEKTNRTSILGPSDDDAQSRDSMSLLYGTDEDSILNLMSKPKNTELSLADDQETAEEADQEAPIPVEQQAPPVVESVSAEEEIQDKKKKFEDLWKDENEIDEAASVLNYLDSVQSARREAETEEEAVPAPTTSLKIIDVATPMQTPERPPRPDENADQDTAEQVLEALVDMVPETNTASKDNQMNLPLPATLDANFQDSVSVSSSISGTSSNVSGTPSKQRLLGESARTKTPTNKWNVASPASTMDHSVRSTDSARLRSLLGQGDMNDAALFGKKPQTDDKSASTSSSVNEMEVSMSSCTSNQLKSLLTTESREVGSDDEEDFLFTKTVTEENGQMQNEEKKEAEDLEADDDDEEDRTSSYLPQNITPRAQVPSPTFGQGQDDTSTVYSALSEAPSVDETIKSDMGWF